MKPLFFKKDYIVFSLSMEAHSHCSSCKHDRATHGIQWFKRCKKSVSCNRPLNGEHHFWRSEDAQLCQVSWNLSLAGLEMTPRKDAQLQDAAAAGLGYRHSQSLAAILRRFISSPNRPGLCKEPFGHYGFHLKTLLPELYFSRTNSYSGHHCEVMVLNPEIPKEHTKYDFE